MFPERIGMTIKKHVLMEVVVSKLPRLYIAPQLPYLSAADGITVKPTKYAPSMKMKQT